MRARFQPAVLWGLLIAAGVGAGACLSPPGKACGDGWCPEGTFCETVELVCVKSGCGNGFVEDDEECDDGNLDDGDDCLSTCRRNTCGDGNVDLVAEECDDGNVDDGDACLSTCRRNTCGDGKVDLANEACDDGNSSDEDDCLATCKRNTCRDGFLDQQPPNLEICDDRNANNDDGCNNACMVSLPAYLKASNTDPGDRFGSSVAISADGSTLAVGAVFEASVVTGIDGNQGNNSAINSGAVYVFTRSGMTWSQQAYVKASNTGTGDQFGHSVTLSADGSTLAVGAIAEASSATGVGGNQTNNNAGGSGAVYVFARSGTTWSQEAYVKASLATPGEFGHSVALSPDGSTLAVGAIRELSAATGINGNQANYSAMYAGAVYVFARSGTTWSQQAYVKASNTNAGDRFGQSVALSANGSTPGGRCRRGRQHRGRDRRRPGRQLRFIGRGGLRVHAQRHGLEPGGLCQGVQSWLI